MANGIEALSKNGEEKFKISDLNERFGIKVSNDEVKKYEDAFFSMKEIEKIQSGKITVSEVATASLETLRNGVKKTQEEIGRDLKKSQEILAKGKEEASESFNEISGKIEKLESSETATKVKEKAEEIKDKASDFKDDIGAEGVMVWLEGLAKEGGLLGFFASLLLGIAKIFGYKGGIEKVAEKADKLIEKLSPEKIKETKEKTKQIIVKGLGGTLTPENQAKLDSTIDGLSKEQINTLYEKLKKGELNFGEIGKILPNFFNEIISPAQIEKIKKDIQNSLIEAFKKEIKEKYNIDLDEGKLAKLRELVEKNTTISNETIGLFYEKLEKKEVKIKDIYGPGYEALINTSSLMIGLLINGIVPVSAFSMDFAKSGTELIKFSIESMGIGSTISIDSFNESVKNMNDTQKALLIGLLYRKGGLFLNMIGSIGESISRLGIEFLTNTQVKGYQTLGAGLSGNYSKQAELFGKLSKNISPELYSDTNDILKKANDAFKKLEQNYKIIDILQNSSGDVAKATELLKKANITIPAGIDLSDFNKFVEGFKPSMEHTFEGLSKGAITSKLGFGASADLYELESKIQKITQAQRRLLDGNFLVKGIAKLRELSNIGEVSRMGDRMVLHFSSKEEALKGISKWNILANKFPEIVKGSLDKLPIIAVAGIAANSDKPFFEEFSKEMKYLFPIVGPILLIGDSGLNWENGKPKITNGIDAGIGGALLAIDGVFLLKEISKSGIKGGATYMIKPFRDIYGLGRGTLEGAYSIGKAINGGKTISGAIKEAINKSKAIKSPKVRAIAIIGLIGYAGYNYAIEDDSLKEVFDKEGKLDKEKLKNELPNLNDKDKTTVLKYILSGNLGENFFKNTNIEIKNNVLYIKSNDEKIQESWFIEQETLEILGLNPKIEFSYEKKPA